MKIRLLTILLLLAGGWSYCLGQSDVYPSLKYGEPYEAIDLASLKKGYERGQKHYQVDTVRQELYAVKGEIPGRIVSFQRFNLQTLKEVTRGVLELGKGQVIDDFLFFNQKAYIVSNERTAKYLPKKLFIRQVDTETGQWKQAPVVLAEFKGVQKIEEYWIDEDGSHFNILVKYEDKGYLKEREIEKKGIYRFDRNFKLISEVVHSYPHNRDWMDAKGYVCHNEYVYFLHHVPENKEAMKQAKRLTIDVPSKYELEVINLTKKETNSYAIPLPEYFLSDGILTMNTIGQLVYSTYYTDKSVAETQSKSMKKRNHVSNYSKIIQNGFYALTMDVKGRVLNENTQPFKVTMLKENSTESELESLHQLIENNQPIGKNRMRSRYSFQQEKGGQVIVGNYFRRSIFEQTITYQIEDILVCHAGIDQSSWTVKIPVSLKGNSPLSAKGYEAFSHGGNTYILYYDAPDNINLTKSTPPKPHLILNFGTLFAVKIDGQTGEKEKFTIYNTNEVPKLRYAYIDRLLYAGAGKVVIEANIEGKGDVLVTFDLP